MILWFQNEYHAHNINGQHVSLHTKVIWPTTFLLNSKHLFIQHFVSWATGQYGMSVHEIEWVRTYLPIIYYHKVQHSYVI